MLATSSTQWIRDNKMLCSGDKRKLLIVCNRETRESKINYINTHFTVEVCGKETGNEKLLSSN